MEVRTIRGRYDSQSRAEERYARLKVQAAFFNADDGMVAFADLGWIQTAFNTLTGLFGRVGLRTNVRKLWVWFASHVGRSGSVQTRSTNFG